MESTLALLRLLQIADSGFPVGGFSYSHGLEWLVQSGEVRGEAGMAEFLHPFVEQVVAGQHLPAAAKAHRSRTLAAAIRADVALDASIAADAEREGGRAMGSRMLELGASALSSERCAALFRAVREGETPGQFTIAFALAAADAGAGERKALSALAFGLVTSVTQAAVRLGTIGAEAATRLTSSSLQQINGAVDRAAGVPRPRIGAFAPAAELATMLQPTLRFRMFAS